MTYFDTYRQGPVYNVHLVIIHLLIKAYQDFQKCGNDVASHIRNFVPFMKAIYPNITNEIVFPFVSLLKDYPDLITL